MRWEGGRRSTQVDDRRRGPGVAAAGGGMGCITVVVILVFLLLGGDPEVVATVLDAQQASQQAQPTPRRAAPAGDDTQAEFVKVILADTEDVWGSLFRQGGQQYPQPTLVLFEDAVASACGRSTSAVGPFYCPGDRKVYIDLSFFRQLDQRFGAPGDFAQAYVLAHEVGHHVQNVLGTMEKVQRQQASLPEAEANKLSVKLELQADCYAGVWAHHAQAQRQLLEAGDIEEGMRAATAIGDDTLQRMSQGFVQPERFTHGTSQQRVDWFARGLQTGDIQQCNTFR